MATSVAFPGFGGLLRQQDLSGFSRVRRSKLKSWCSKSSSSTSDDGEECEEAGVNLEIAKELKGVLQSEESKALLRDLDEAVQRVENAKWELQRLDEQEEKSEKESTSSLEFLQAQEALIEGCEEELAAAKAETEAAEIALVTLRAGGAKLNQQVERLESSKAAVVACLSGVAASVPLTLADFYSSGVPLNVLIVRESTIFVSCALFGVCYRYILRTDVDNGQLKSGCAGAFALARGLGQVDALQKNVDDWMGLALEYLGQSFIIFLSAALVLDLCLQAKILKPFSSQTTKNI